MPDPDSDYVNVPMRVRLLRRGPAFYLKLATLVTLVVGVALLHYLTGAEESPYYELICRLYYLPIVLGGVWFCLPGGVGVALLVSVVFAPHLMFQWGSVPDTSFNQTIEVLLFNLLGVVTGLLASRIQVQQHRAEENNLKLSESYAKLREQADLIVEIEDQLRLADRLSALGELSAGMAHEIRNPLGSIRGTAEILHNALPDDHRYAEFSRILVSEVERLNQVVEDFLKFARSEKEEPCSFDLHQVLNEVLQLSRRQIKKDDFQIHWRPSSLPPAVGDAGQFKQVFLNLILNAWQAAEDRGQLWIAAEKNSAGDIAMTFRDDGPGFPADHLDKIFNPFFTTKADGTGLGLAITYRIVRNHGGRITAANHPQGGAEFKLLLKSAEAAVSQGERHEAQYIAD